MKKPETFKGIQKSIIADFITKLLLFKNSTTKIIYNNILVVIYRLTKYVYFIFYLEIATAKDFIYISIRNIIANYKMPEKIILDKNKLFISKFRKSLINKLKTRYKMFTAYYL